MSRIELAERSAVHPETVGRIERRQHVPHEATLQLLAAALDVPTKALRVTATASERMTNG